MVGHTRAAGAVTEWRQHGSVVAPCLAGIMLVSAHGYALGVMMHPLELAFGWPRAEISAGYMIISMMALFLGPLVGRAVDRWGPRRIALIGVPLYCVTLAGLSLAGPSILSWWALWVLLALGAIIIMPVVWLAALNGFFHASRGLAMAVSLSGTGVAAAFFPALVNALVEHFGWRGAYLGLAAICFAVVYPLTFLLFREAGSPPAPHTVAEDGLVPPAVPIGPDARTQMRSARFVKLALATVLFAVSSCALTNNMVPVLLGEGLSSARAAATAGLLGIGSIAGRLVGGFLLDRLDGNKVAAVCVLLPVMPASILLATDHSEGWSALACLLMGLSVGTELDACGYLAARHFGTRNFGVLFGSMNGLLLFGAGLAPLLANYVFDVAHSYDPVLVALIPLFALTSLLFLTLGSYEGRDPVTGELPPSSPHPDGAAVGAGGIG